jgi:hypothetical protein
MIPTFPLFNGCRGCFPEVKWLGHEANNSPPSSDEVKNGQSYTSTPVYAFMPWRVKTLLLLYRSYISMSFNKLFSSGSCLFSCYVYLQRRGEKGMKMNSSTPIHNYNPFYTTELRNDGTSNMELTLCFMILAKLIYGLY